MAAFRKQIMIFFRARCKMIRKCTELHPRFAYSGKSRGCSVALLMHNNLHTYTPTLNAYCLCLYLLIAIFVLSHSIWFKHFFSFVFRLEFQNIICCIRKTPQFACEHMEMRKKSHFLAFAPK